MIGNKFAADELARNFLASVSKNKVINQKNHEDIKKAAQDTSRKDTVEHSAEDFILDEEDVSGEQHASAIDKQIRRLSDDEKCNKCGYAHDINASCDSMSGYAMDAPSQDTFSRNSLQASDHLKESKRISSALSKIASGLKSKGNIKEANVVMNVAREIKAEGVSSELAKIASSLKSKGKLKEANVVLKTAKEVLADQKPSAKPEDALAIYMDKKSSYVASELSKIASELRASGNGFAADMVDITNTDIKKEAFVKASGKAYIVSELLKMAKQSYAEGDRMTADVIHATVLNIKNKE